MIATQFCAQGFAGMLHSARHPRVSFCLRFVIMERMAWTDERMDDFAAHTYRRFDEVDRRFDRVDAELQRVNDRLDGLHRILMQTGAGIFVALLGLIATQL
jgi:hypothetical protein